MTMHLQDDELILHYYGEADAPAESRTTQHLGECTECRTSYTRLQRVLDAVDEASVVAPALPDGFERTVWARLQPALQTARPGWRSWVVLAPAHLALAAAVVVLVAGAFFAGRLFPRETAVPATQSAATPSQVRERILLVDLSDHLDRSQMVLVELVSAPGTGAVDISSERARAEQLIAANRLYRQTAVETGDAGVSDLLDELERVLIDVAASPEEMSAVDLSDVQRRIESRGLLFKVRVVASEVRQRQKSAVQQRAGQRS
jgi:anti-sigma factor RsiW